MSENVFGEESLLDGEDFFVTNFIFYFSGTISIFFFCERGSKHFRGFFALEHFLAKLCGIK
jgi:hypothetical protein